jgi:hypothetical protein
MHLQLYVNHILLAQAFDNHIMFGPTEFEMQAYKGNMKSWQDLENLFIH